MGGFIVTHGSEDCLTLNIYVPERAKEVRTITQPQIFLLLFLDVDTAIIFFYLFQSGKMPVMVWLHGGAFTTGDASDVMFGPRYFTE